MKLTNMEQEMKYRFGMLANKDAQIEALTYEKSVIEQDIVNFYKERTTGEICEMVDFHTAWIEQPEPDPDRNYLEIKRTTTFERLMWLILNNIFNKTAKDIRFTKKICMNGFGTESISVPFTYKNKDFQLNLPNIKCLYEFKTFKWHGMYRLFIREGESTIVEIASYYTSDDMFKNIDMHLDKACEEATDE